VLGAKSSAQPLDFPSDLNDRNACDTLLVSSDGAPRSDTAR
jgi:hypothetical protein